MKYCFGVLFVFAAALVQTAGAQGKVGYFNPDQMLSIMPERVKVDSMITVFQRDSMSAAFSKLATEYQFKDSILTKTDTSKTPKAQLAQLKTDVQSLAYQGQNWQSISNQVVGARARQLYAPLSEKINAAVKQVAKEKGYAFVVSKQTLVVAPPGDDLLPYVAAKLGVKLPQAPKPSK